MTLFDGILSWAIAIIIAFGLVLAVMSFIYFVIITFSITQFTHMMAHVWAGDERHVPD